MIYYGTFGQKLPRLRDHYVVIHAATREAAQDEMTKLFGDDWSMLYREGRFRPEYFPAGPMRLPRAVALVSEYRTEQERYNRLQTEYSRLRQSIRQALAE